MPVMQNNPISIRPTTMTTATSQTHEQLSETRQEARPGFLGSLLGSTILAVPDFVDTVGSSVIPGVERGMINDATVGSFLSAVGSPGLNRFVNDQRGATEVISGIGGMLIADRIAGRLGRPGGFVMEGLRAVPGVRNIVALDKAYDRALKASVLGMREVAARGEMGASSLSSVVGYRSLGVAGRLDLGAARTGTKQLGAALGARRAFGAELVMATTMNTNRVFFSEDWTDNLANGAIGITLGGALGGLQAGWQLRRAANSDSVVAELVGAYDPRGHEAARRVNAPITAPLMTKDFLGFDNGLETDVITSMMLHAKESRLPAKDATERSMRLFGNRQEFATETERLVFQRMNKVTQDGLHSVAGTSFNDSSPAFRALREGMEREPTLLYGASEVGVANPNLGIGVTDASRKVALESKIEGLGELLKNNGRKKLNKDGVEVIEPLTSEERLDIAANLRKLWYDNSKQGMVQLFPGELAPMEFSRVVDKMIPRKIFPETTAGKTVYQAEKVEGADSTLGIGDDLSIFTSENRHPSQLPMHDVIQLYRVARHATDRIAKTNKVVVLGDKPNWLQLDMAERIIQKSDNPAKIVFPNGMTREDALVESFAQKVDAVRGSFGFGPMTQQPVFGPKAYDRIRPPLNDVDAFAARIKFNLPQFTPAQSSLFQTAENPLETLLYSFKNGDDVRKLGLQRLKEELKAAGEIQGLTDHLMRPFEAMNGRSFDFLMDRDGLPMEPVMVYKRQMAPDDWTRDALDSSMAMKKAYQRGVIMSETADPITRELATAIYADPNYHQALKVQELADNQHSSFIPGLGNKAPQSAWGALTNSLSTREWRDRDIMTLTSASRVRDLQDRVTRDLMAKTVTGIMGDIMTRVANPRAGESRVMLNHFFSQRQGWTLAEEIGENGEKLDRAEVVSVALPNGDEAFQFRLADTPNNKQRFELQYGYPMEEDQLLLNAQGVPITVDALGLEALNRFEQLSEAKRKMQNTLLRASGLPEIQRQYMWVPSPETRGKFIAMTFDATGKVVPGGGIVANTVEELTRREGELAASQFFQPGYVIRRRDTVTNYMDLWDKAQMDWHDPSLTMVAPGKVNKGRLTGQDIDLHAWDRANAQMVDGFIDHGRDVMRFLTKDAVDAARIRAEVGRVETKVGAGSRQLKHGGIFDRYVQNITGTASNADRQGMIAPIFNALEDRVNSFLADATPNSSKIYQALGDKFKSINPFIKSDTNQQLFDKMVKDLGPYMPFRSAAELVQAQTGHALPKDIKEISAKISWMEATSKLRWLESVHAIMNFGSMVHNLPSITKSLQRLADESDEAWAKRIGHVSTIFGDKHKTAVVNPAKLMYLAMKDARATQHDEFTRKAFDRGFMNQEVAELERQWSSVKTPGHLRSFFFGNPNADPSTVAGKIAKKGGLDYYLGYMSDKSEDFTRRMAMYYGRRIAQMHGIEKVDDQLSFAHDIANKTIANYDPRNRSEIFQGAFGAPIGLFQSYIVNYYQRLFRMFETKDTKALASQALWQGGVMGVKSFGPFWGMANSMFFDRGEALEDNTDSFEHRLGTAESDLLMYGVLANLPKMFGGDGASIYTRGDINVRLPVANMPITDSVKRIWNGYSQMWDAFTETNDHLTGQQLAEILSNTVGNRPLAGLIEQVGAGGYDTDANGQVISNADSLFSLNTAYRLMGVKSMSQQKEVEAFYQNKEAAEQQAAKQTSLRLATRANIRAGNFDALPSLFVSYVENGGNRKYFTRWYKDAMESATETRSERMLVDLMKNDSKMAQVNRLLDAGVTPQMDAENDDDYGREAEIMQRTRAEAQMMFAADDSQQSDSGLDSIYDPN